MFCPFLPLVYSIKALRDYAEPRTMKGWGEDG